MGFPVLIAHTPRAGRWNHLTLLPAGGLPAGLKAADFLGAAAVRPAGGNYLAAVRVVPQAGGTKEGQEVLALVGVRPPAGPDREAVLGWLADRLDALGGVVAGTDWALHDGSDYRVPELDGWRAEAVAAFGLRPHPRTVLSPVAEEDHPPPTRRRVGVAAAVFAAALAIGFVLPGVRAAVADLFTPPPAPRAAPGGPPPGAGGLSPAKADEIAKAQDRYDRMVKDVLDQAGGDPLATKEQLVRDIAEALDGTNKWNKSSGFDTHNYATQRAEVLQHPGFRTWLANSDRENVSRIWNPFVGDVTSKRKDLETGIGGSLGAPIDAYKFLGRAELLRAFLADCRTLLRDGRRADTDQRKVLPLIGWLDDLASSEAFPSRIPRVPFVTPPVAEDLTLIAGHLTRLSSGFRVEHGLPADFDIRTMAKAGPDPVAEACDDFEKWQKSGKDPDCRRWTVAYLAAGPDVREVGRQLRLRIKDRRKLLLTPG